MAYEKRLDHLWRRFLLTVCSLFDFYNSVSVKKMTEDSVMVKYEAEAIAIENEEKNERNKREVIEEMRRLQRETEGKQYQ